MTDAFYGILIPFLGTSLGAASVFFLKKSLGDYIQRALTGFAAGVMVAASIWSLLIPAMDQSEALGKLAFFPRWWVSGWGSCFCCCWIISSHTCTGTANRLRAPTASCSAPP